MKTLTFIRHAESVSNAGDTTMPHEAIPLSELGHQQARELAARLIIKPSIVLMAWCEHIKPLRRFASVWASNHKSILA